MSAYVVSWSDVMDYFKFLERQAIGEMARADTDRKLWQAQGKLALVQELLNLKDIFATLQEIGAEKPELYGSQKGA